MNRKRSFVRESSDYRRVVPRFAPSDKIFLIVTEGEKTEPNYFIALRERLRLAKADVQIIHPDGTDPLTLTWKAIEMRDDKIRQAKKGEGFAVPFDEVWVVFDLEKQHDHRRELARQAMALKEAEGILFAISDPAFEYWLLLHEEYTTAPFADCNAIIKRLRRFWKSYAKGASTSIDFIEKLQTAISRAKSCRKHHKTCNGNGNPSTKVDILAQNLNSATRPNFRI